MCLRIFRWWACLGAIVMLLACQSSQPALKEPTHSQEKIISRELKAHQEAFAERNPEVMWQYGALRTVVRMAAASSLPTDQSGVGAALSVEGVGSAALGFAVPTIYSSALVVGGVFLVPGGAWLYFHEKKVWNAIGTAMRQVELTKGISQSMQNRAKAQFTEAGAPGLEMEITINGFGLVKSRNGFHHCLVISADCAIKQGNHPIGMDRLKIAEIEGSDDAPPPQCAHLERFADHDARLLKVHMAEMTQIIAVMAIQRLEMRSR